MVPYERFLPDILPEVPGVSDPLAISAVRNACYDFCAKTLVWNEVLDPEAISVGESEYPLSAPNGAQVIQVMDVVIDGRYTIHPTTLSILNQRRPNWRTRRGMVDTYFQPTPNTLWLVAVPEQEGEFIATVAYAPTRESSSTADILYNNYLEAIRCGALSRLKAYFDKPWSDPAGAARYEARFLMAANNAVVSRNRSNTLGTLRVTPVPF